MVEYILVRTWPGEIDILILGAWGCGAFGLCLSGSFDQVDSHVLPKNGCFQINNWSF